MNYISPSTGMAVQAVLFDTFGTVVDWRTGVARQVSAFFECHDIELDAHVFADAWRARYEPSMEPIRSGQRGYTLLEQLHFENLLATFKEAGVDTARLSQDDLDDLNRSWERLDPWPDSMAGLETLTTRYTVGPLSNANSGLLERMAAHAGLPWTVVIGSDRTMTYKPSREAYLRTAEVLGLEPGEVMLAAAHNTDLAAARVAGLATAFVARTTELGPHQSKDLGPEQNWDVVASSITDLADQLTKEH